ncbi:unnamed protein product [Schistosoma mattheei]|uniref:Uncharacterized protein n=1 Tax=Schistosoma mattheei TaxID=31246 RepID=A0A183NME9_9TREM|nr:unnamed protein product [Schistosoma mattheei]
MLSEEKSPPREKTDLSDRSVIFHKISESSDTKPKARFEHDLNHIKTSLSCSDSRLSREHDWFNKKQLLL